VKLRSLVEWIPLFWSTLVGSQAPLPSTFAIIIIFFIPVAEHYVSASNQVFEKLWSTPTTVAVLLSAL
jgi:hypothetical protein